MVSVKCHLPTFDFKEFEARFITLKLNQLGTTMFVEQSLIKKKADEFEYLQHTFLKVLLSS